MANEDKCFITEKRVCVIKPAGYGKTYLIANALKEVDGDRFLILTHTHAGIRSIKNKLKDLNVPSSKAVVETIAGFAFKYATAFPKISKFMTSNENEQFSNEIYSCALNVINSSIGSQIISSSYDGAFVDEYQDCLDTQHELIMSIANLIPCRIVGDPLQGIFDFGSNVIVDWKKDVFPNFVRLDLPNEPWRWKANMDLGAWLYEIRKCLILGREIDLRKAPPSVKWVSHTSIPKVGQINECYRVARLSGSIVAIHNISQITHVLAKSLKGIYTSMDEIEGKDLLRISEKFDKSSGLQRAISVLEFVILCSAGDLSDLRAILKKISKDNFNITARNKNSEIYGVLKEVRVIDNWELVVYFLALVKEKLNLKICRRELWNDMRKSLEEFNRGGYSSIKETSLLIRGRGRIIGRSVYNRTISRVLLIKGLEFDHAIVLDADKLNAKELYVAMTRGASTLTVISNSPLIKREKIKF